MCLCYRGMKLFLLASYEYCHWYSLIVDEVMISWHTEQNISPAAMQKYFFHSDVFVFKLCKTFQTSQELHEVHTENLHFDRRSATTAAFRVPC